MNNMSNLEAKFKETGIGPIPEEWNVLSLEEAVDFNPRRSIKKGQLVKFVAMTEIDPFTKKIKSFSEKPFSGGTKFKNGDTLMARITPCLENGKIAYVDFLQNEEVAGGSTEYIVLSGKKGVSDPSYVYYLTISPEIRQAAITAMTGTTGRQRVENDKLASKLIALPPLQEQERIASILSSLDDKIELNRQMNATLEKIASTLFKHWFVDFEFPDKNGKPYKSSGGKMVESELGEIPEGWRVGKMSDLIRVESGFPFSSGMFDDTGEYGLVTIKNVQNGIFVSECTDHLANFPFKMPEYCKLESGDILISLTGNVGRVCIVNGDGFVLNQRVAKLAPVEESNRAFVYVYSRRSEFQNDLINISRGTAQQNLSPVEMKNLETVIPGVNVLALFGEVTGSIFEMIVENLNHIKALSEIRDSLLPRLMNGKIRAR